MKNVTRKDIAEKLGVSVSVVSRVINNSGYVSKEKREKVLKAAKDMYRILLQWPFSKTKQSSYFFSAKILLLHTTIKCIMAW